MHVHRSFPSALLQRPHRQTPDDAAITAVIRDLALTGQSTTRQQALAGKLNRMITTALARQAGLPHNVRAIRSALEVARATNPDAFADVVFRVVDYGLKLKLELADVLDECAAPLWSVVARKHRVRLEALRRDATPTELGQDYMRFLEMERLGKKGKNVEDGSTAVPYMIVLRQRALCVSVGKLLCSYGRWFLFDQLKTDCDMRERKTTTKTTQFRLVRGSDGELRLESNTKTKEVRQYRRRELPTAPEDLTIQSGTQSEAPDAYDEAEPELDRQLLPPAELARLIAKADNDAALRASVIGELEVLAHAADRKPDRARKEERKIRRDVVANLEQSEEQAAKLVRYWYGRRAPIRDLILGAYHRVAVQLQRAG